MEVDLFVPTESQQGTDIRCAPRELAHQGALGGQVVVLYQLLGNGAAARNHRPGAEVAQRGAGDAGDGETPVAVEVLVLHRQQAAAHGVRDILQAHQHPVFTVGGIDPADLHGIQAHQVDGGSA